MNTNIYIKSSLYNKIYEKIQNNINLTAQDGISIYQSNDLLSIGELADTARVLRLENNKKSEEKNYVYWINNHHLNLTNICEGKCKFCAYRRQEGQKGAFKLSLFDAINYIETKINKNVSEIHIVSGLNPDYDLNFYKNLFKECLNIIPKVHIQALTAVEIDYIAKISNKSVQEVLLELIKSGLGSLPGGGAEIFSERIRQKNCPQKISGKRWLEIMETAHKLGIKSNVTMLTGIGETINEKIDHMLAVRELQSRTDGFMAFIPLFCHYKNTEIKYDKCRTGIEILKEYALSRLMLDNISHIKAFWIQTGLKIAQVSLFFGVDDLDGTVMEEKITKFAGAEESSAISKQEIVHLIRSAGKIPMERNTLYNIISN
jgi:aminodeoxyfutalosine synthase